MRCHDVSHPPMGVAATPRRVAAGQIPVRLGDVPGYISNVITPEGLGIKSKDGGQGGAPLGLPPPKGISANFSSDYL